MKSFLYILLGKHSTEKMTTNGTQLADKINDLRGGSEWMRFSTSIDGHGISRPETDVNVDDPTPVDDEVTLVGETAKLTEEESLPTADGNEFVTLGKKILYEVQKDIEEEVPKLDNLESIALNERYSPNLADKLTKCYLGTFPF